MRGLKHFCLNGEHHRHEVASFTDAWIETKSTLKALPSSSVASFTDAWIETIGASRRQKRAIVASFTDAWIETRITYQSTPGCCVASFTDAWIETLSDPDNVGEVISRIFYRCVD